MKRILSAVLCVIFLCGLLAGCSSPGGRKTKTDLSGKEIAKLLLANSRLNSEDFAGGLAFGGTANSVAYSTKEPSYRVKLLSSSTGNGTVSWSDFTPECDAYSFFESYFMNIEAEAENFAFLIDEVKNNCNITDYWIEYGGEDIMLKVDANTETIYVRTDHGYSVCRRYTNSDARDVYEMYRAETASEISVDLQLRMLYIPEQRYEFSLVMEGDATYIVAENDRGYWNMFQISDAGSHANVMNLVDTGDVTFTISTMIDPNMPTPAELIFSTSDLGCDIVRVIDGGLSLNLAAFNGVSSIQAPSQNVEFLEGGTTALTLPEGMLVTTNGTRVENYVPYANGTVEMFAVTADYNASDGTTSGNVDLHVQGQTPAEQFANLQAFLNEVGMSCKYDLNAIAGKINVANTMVDEFFNYYTWRGSGISSYSGIKTCIAAENAAMDALAQMYEAAKDAKKVELTDKGFAFEDWDFAAIDALNCGTVTFENGTVTVEGMSVSMNDLDILDAGQNYTVCLALARLSGSSASMVPTAADYSYGSYVLLGATSLADLNEADYDNAVILSGEGMDITSYDSGSSLTLSQSASFVLPDCTEAASFTVVAYVATEDGIRVSQMLPIIFSSEVEQSKSLDGLKTRLHLNDEKHLMVDCTVDVDVYLTVDELQESYTYTEMYELLLSHVLNHGLPVDGAQVEIFDPNAGTGQVAAEDALLSGCVCRMAYVRQVDGQELPGYIYLDVTGEGQSTAVLS